MSVYMYLVAKEGEGMSFNLEEGNFTRGTFRADEGVAKGGTYAAEIEDGDFVEIVTTADKCVQKAATGIKIGYMDGDPLYTNPSSSLTSGNYTRATGNIILMGGNVHKVKLDAGNQKVAPGDYLAIDTTNKNALDKEEDTTTNIIALEAADASSGKAILAFVRGNPVTEADAGA